MESQPVIEIDFAELSDGSLIETIEDPADLTQTLLAVCSHGQVRYTKRLDDQGRILVPLSRTDEHLKYVRLAQGAEPYGQVLDLAQSINGIFCACLDLDDEWRIAMVAFVLSGWLPEKLPVAPYLSLVGAPASGKSTALRVLNLFCYRSVLTADVSSAAFYDISHHTRATFLLDETLTAGQPRQLMHLLKASSTPDCVSLRKDKARLAYGPKAFAWLKLPDDAALNSRCIAVPMHKASRTDLKSPSDPEILERTKKIRMQLQQFRFEFYKKVSVPKNPSDLQLSGRLLDLFRALAMPFAQDEGMCRTLGLLIAGQSQFQARLLPPDKVSTIRVLYNFIHEYPDKGSFRMSVLTAAVNADLASRGESAGVNERKLGDVLTSLCFTNRYRKNSGYVLQLDRSDRARIHTMARDQEVEGIQSASVENCQNCCLASVRSLISVLSVFPNTLGEISHAPQASARRAASKAPTKKKRGRRT